MKNLLVVVFFVFAVHGAVGANNLRGGQNGVWATLTSVFSPSAPKNAPVAVDEDFTMIGETNGTNDELLQVTNRYEQGRQAARKKSMFGRLMSYFSPSAAKNAPVAPAGGYEDFTMIDGNGRQGPEANAEHRQVATRYEQGRQAARKKSMFGRLKSFILYNPETGKNDAWRAPIRHSWNKVKSFLSWKRGGAPNGKPSLVDPLPAVQAPEPSDVSDITEKGVKEFFAAQQAEVDEKERLEKENFRNACDIADAAGALHRAERQKLLAEVKRLRQAAA